MGLPQAGGADCGLPHHGRLGPAAAQRHAARVLRGTSAHHAGVHPGPWRHDGRGNQGGGHLHVRPARVFAHLPPSVHRDDLCPPGQDGPPSLRPWPAG
eukprot:3146289-Alexandrium_andersonii.AAC.1